MKTLFWALLLAFLASSCLATSGDLERIALKIDDVERGTATMQDLQDVVVDVKEDIEERTRTGLEGIGTTGGISALITGIGLAVLNNRRNKTRGTDPRVSNALKT